MGNEAKARGKVEEKRKEKAKIATERLIKGLEKAETRLKKSW